MEQKRGILCQTQINFSNILLIKSKVNQEIHFKTRHEII